MMRSLSARLLVLTVLFVMIAEILIFVPSVARFRHDWLTERLSAAHLAILALDVAPPLCGCQSCCLLHLFLGNAGALAELLYENLWICGGHR